MNFNFELILFYATVISGLIALFDIVFLARKRKAAYLKQTQNMKEPPELKLPLLIDYARAFFPILLLVFLLRSFVFEPFRIPSGSLEPTLATGDFVLVNKFHYGIRLPILHTIIYHLDQPKRGDIVVFRWPADPSIDFIKRIVGLPGDRIKYVNKILYVNDKEIPQEFIKNTTTYDENGDLLEAVEKQETLFGVKHSIFQNEDRPNDDMNEIIVPPGMYFAMGDNRDHSADSRYWGFVPDKNIIGKASYIWMSWDSIRDRIRWNRIGKKII